MTRRFRVSLAATIGLAMAAPAGFAQQPAATKPAPAAASSPAVTETRPATTTFQGDTGLWFVPLGEVLPGGRWSGSVYYTNFDRQEGFTDISTVPVTFVARRLDRPSPGPTSRASDSAHDVRELVR